MSHKQNYRADRARKDTQLIGVQKLDNSGIWKEIFMEDPMKKRDYSHQKPRKAKICCTPNPLVQTTATKNDNQITSDLADLDEAEILENSNMKSQFEDFGFGYSPPDGSFGGEY